ncbi:hypothetical protein Pmani_010858 [Petrolisthes manimaculis]|uniref:Uncharacterized protein n=1 Tax=Petrolisthes manimaculis TaxID=1843537 RepID=A0AAE1Q1C1_9EUCA|nr:hypothetical protein Pmani_019158 [Petrolisthes manimaculis]KAK4318128.1 hypothetical protein Pmani_010858 [Petrolisthes manimaculis]
MNGVWKKLCPQYVNNFTSFEKVQEEVVSNMISMSDKLELDLEEQDFVEFFDAHAKELTNDKLRELEKQRKEGEEEEVEVPAKHFQTKVMAQAFALVEEAMALLESQDPNEERHVKVSSAVSDALKCYQVIYDEKKKAVTQSSIHRFFKRVDKHETQVPSTSQSVSSTSEPVPLQVPSSPITDDPSPISSPPSSPSTSSHKHSPAPTNPAE